MCMFKFNLLSKWPIGFFIPSDIGSHNFLCSVLHMTSILKFKHLLLWYIPALLTVFLIVLSISLSRRMKTSHQMKRRKNNLVVSWLFYLYSFGRHIDSMLESGFTRGVISHVFQLLSSPAD